MLPIIYPQPHNHIETEVPFQRFPKKEITIKPILVGNIDYPVRFFLLPFHSHNCGYDLFLWYQASFIHVEKGNLCSVFKKDSNFLSTTLSKHKGKFLYIFVNRQYANSASADRSFLLLQKGLFFIWFLHSFIKTEFQVNHTGLTTQNANLFSFWYIIWYIMSQGKRNINSSYFIVFCLPIQFEYVLNA